jgi:hypothetical protein
MKTTIYHLTVPAGDDKNKTLDELIYYLDQEPEAERSGAGFDNQGDPRVLYRTTGDDLAISVARAILEENQTGQLHTGLGVHRRLVKTF